MPSHPTDGSKAFYHLVQLHLGRVTESLRIMETEISFSSLDCQAESIILCIIIIDVRSIGVSLVPHSNSPAQPICKPAFVKSKLASIISLRPRLSLAPALLDCFWPKAEICY